MTNEYLDTYYGVVRDSEGNGVELATVRATDFSDARDKLGEPEPGHSLEVKRWRHPRLIASPSDIERARRKKQRRSKVVAPQYNAKRRKNHDDA